MAFAIKRRPTPPPPLNGTNFHLFLPHFFLLQLSLTYMKRTLHLVRVKIIIFFVLLLLIISSKLITTSIFSHIHGHLIQR